MFRRGSCGGHGNGRGGAGHNSEVVVRYVRGLCGWVHSLALIDSVSAGYPGALTW